MTKVSGYVHMVSTKRTSFQLKRTVARAHSPKTMAIDIYFGHSIYDLRRPGGMQMQPYVRVTTS